MRHSLVTSVTALAIIIVGAASAQAQTPAPTPKKKPGFEFVMPAGEPLSMSVNISGHDIAHASFVARVGRA